MRFSREQVEDLRLQTAGLFIEFRSRIPWLQGVGIGEKVTGGLPTGEDSLVFFVGRKFNEADLRRGQIIPDHLSLVVLGEDLRLDTDVIEVDEFEFIKFCNCKSERPAKGGNCLGPQGAPWLGTLGGIVTNPANGKHHIISCAHVLAGFNQFPLGHPIVQPGGGAIIANLTQSVLWSTTTVMSSDSAIAEVVNNNDVDRLITGIGVPQGLTSPSGKLPIRKSGSRTCLSLGSISYAGCVTQVAQFIFKDVFLASLSADEGDSGSLVLDDDRRIVGLLFAKNSQFGACNDIANVVADLGLGGWFWT